MSIYADRSQRFHRTGFHRDAAGKIVIEPKKEWYSVKEAARILEIGRMSVQRHIYSGELEAQKMGGVHRAGRWRVPYDALQDFLVRSNERR